VYRAGAVLIPVEEIFSAALRRISLAQGSRRCRLMGLLRRGPASGLNEVQEISPI